MRKVWCHQIWIQTYLGFIVLILQVHTSCFFCLFQSKKPSEFSFLPLLMNCLSKKEIANLKIYSTSISNKQKCCNLFITYLLLHISHNIAFLNWDSQQDRDLATSGRNKKNFNWANLILMLWGKSGVIKFEFKPT
jgi:hypothetical protein